MVKSKTGSRDGHAGGTPAVCIEYVQFASIHASSLMEANRLLSDHPEGTKSERTELSKQIRADAPNFPARGHRTLATSFRHH